MFLKKKKNLLGLVIIGLIAVAIIGTVVYFSWLKNVSESKEQVNLKEEIQWLQKKLTSLRSEIINLSDDTKKQQLESRLFFLENFLNDFSGQQNQDKSTIKRLDNEIKKLKKRLGNDEPDDNEIKEEKLRFVVGIPDDEGRIVKYCFNNFLEQGLGELKHFYIRKDHPRIKELLREGKLQEKKQFTIRYGEVDEQEGTVYNFNEFNQKLEIIEV